MVVLVIFDSTTIHALPSAQPGWSGRDYIIMGRGIMDKDY